MMLKTGSLDPMNLRTGSLDLVIEPKTSEELLCNLRPNSSGCDGPQTGNELPVFLLLIGIIAAVYKF